MKVLETFIHFCRRKWIKAAAIIKKIFHLFWRSPFISNLKSGRRRKKQKNTVNWIEFFFFFWRQGGRAFLQESVAASSRVNVIRFVEISPLWQNSASLWAILRAKISTWQNFKPSLGNCYSFGKFTLLYTAQYWKIIQPSGHTVEGQFLFISLCSLSLCKSFHSIAKGSQSDLKYKVAHDQLRLDLNTNLKAVDSKDF